MLRSPRSKGDRWRHESHLSTQEGGTGNLGEFCLVFADLELSNIDRILNKISDLDVLQD